MNSFNQFLAENTNSLSEAVTINTKSRKGKDNPNENRAGEVGLNVKGDEIKGSVVLNKSGDIAYKDRGGLVIVAINPIDEELTTVTLSADSVRALKKLL